MKRTNRTKTENLKAGDFVIIKEVITNTNPRQMKETTREVQKVEKKRGAYLIKLKGMRERLEALKGETVLTVEDWEPDADLSTIYDGTRDQIAAEEWTPEGWRLLGRTTGAVYSWNHGAQLVDIHGAKWEELETQAARDATTDTAPGVWRGAAIIEDTPSVKAFADIVQREEEKAAAHYQKEREDAELLEYTASVQLHGDRVLLHFLQDSEGNTGASYANPRHNKHGSPWRFITEEQKENVANAFKAIRAERNL